MLNRPTSTPKRLPLAGALVALLGVAGSTADAAPSQALMGRPAQHRAADSPAALPFLGIADMLKPSGPAPANPTIHHVTACNDDIADPGSLRNIVTSPLTVSGDRIDFTQLPMGCSTITLMSGQAIEVDQDTLYLDGPGVSSLTIDANNAASVFYHLGAGSLAISDLTIANGVFVNSTSAYGGCIYSTGHVFLFESIVTDCLAMSTDATNPARGGGVYAAGTLTLVRSTISNSTALSSNGAQAFGGGAYVAGFSSHYSTVSGNDARAAGGAQSFGGGVVVTGITDVEGSTISQNYASSIGALWSSNAGTLISNSTISGNVGGSGHGGVATLGGSVSLFNSTIAFNRSIAGTSNGTGLYMPGSTLTLDSSIIADNSGAPGATDLAGLGAQVAGGHSLVTSSTLMLPVGNGNIEGVCPKLDPLLDNGGYTRTHGLNHASPAIDTGDAGNTTLDQRGAPRPTGIAADIGALERQPTDIDERILASNFDGFCDF
jgi:hypothetical protein